MSNLGGLFSMIMILVNNLPSNFNIEHQSVLCQTSWSNCKTENHKNKHTTLKSHTQILIGHQDDDEK